MIEVILWFLGVLGAVNTLIWLLAFKWGLDSLRSLREPVAKPLEPGVSTAIIVPARNEAGNLPLLLDSLLNQDYGDYEVIVVDDNSVDDTYRVILEYARRDPRIIPVRNQTEPPVNWSPKVYAVIKGLEHVKPEAKVLVFLDADTRLLTGNALRILVSNAYYSNSIVSLNPRFKCPTRRCRIAETILTTFAHSFLGFNRVLDPEHKLAWFYGCCWAIRRDVYEKLGGHYTVKHSVVEDRDLAEKAKSKGIPLTILKAWTLVETKWYPNIRDTVEVLARLMKRHAAKKTRTLVEAFLITLSYQLPIINTIIGLTLYNPITVIGAVNYIALILAHYNATKINNYNPLYVLLPPLAGPIMSWGLIEAAKKTKITWRNRQIG